MKGVKVRMTMSLEVKTVSTDTVAYNMKNSFICPDPALESILDAKYRKNPTSSRKTERAVMDKNSVKILRGLMALSLVISANTSPMGQFPVKIKVSAPTRATTQYVSKEILPRRTRGKNKTAPMSSAQVARNMQREKIKKDPSFR